MELTKYTVEEQKGLLNYYNYYYSKGSRTLEDIEEFEQLVETRLDDILKLIVLETFTDFYKGFPEWPEGYSLINMFYFMKQIQEEDDDQDLKEDFFKLINETIEKCEFKEKLEDLVEEALDKFQEVTEKDKDQGLK